MRTLLLLFSAALLFAGAPAQGDGVKTGAPNAPRDRSVPVDPIVIEEGAVWDAGDYDIAVAYIIVGEYEDAAGKKRRGPKARLEIAHEKRDSTPPPTKVKVGEGCEFTVGSHTYRVLDVVHVEGGLGSVQIARK